MKELTKKVVILNNFSSPYVSQAIVILKDYNPKLEGKVISDAEMIVSKYIEKIQKNEQPRRVARPRAKILKIFLCLCAIGVIAAAVKFAG